jgi:hypothetical protein
MHSVHEGSRSLGVRLKWLLYRPKTDRSVASVFPEEIEMSELNGTNSMAPRLQLLKQVCPATGRLCESSCRAVTFAAAAAVGRGG